MKIKKNIFKLIILMIIGIMCTGCVPKQADLDSAETVAKNEIDDLMDAIMRFEMHSMTEFGYDNQWYCVRDGKKESVDDDDSSYIDIISYLNDHDKGSMTETDIGTIILLPSEDYDILYSSQAYEDVQCPYLLDEDIEWVRTDEGENISFVADYRKDKESKFAKSYYRVDMRAISDGLYVYKVQEKIPKQN